jgi:NAD-dependent deacetylase
MPSRRQQSELRRLAGMLRSASAPVALTGAGMSTESGIPDFRGPDGLWQNKTFEELANIGSFRARPAQTWEFYRHRLAGMENAEPNAGHLALAELERLGLLHRVITQNVDGLHARAGSREPLEVHGSLRFADCLDCGGHFTMDAALERADSDGVPRCRCGAALKPGITMFGEMLPPAIDEAYALVASSDLLIACGSSLQVQPVANFAWMMKEQGGRLAIINRGSTGFDHLADVRIEGALGEMLPALLHELT